MTTPAHFNPRPLRGGRPVGGRGGFDEHGISILVFREEGDAPHQPFDKAHTVISIPAFREEGDLASFFIRPMTLSFQSPPSVRKATSPPLPSATGEEDFNPRLP